MDDKTKEFELSGYHLQERIAEARTSVLYRAQRTSDQQPVLLRILTARPPALEVREHFKQEYAMIQRLEGAGVLQVLSLEQDQDHWFMVLEDPGGDLLARLNLAGQLSRRPVRGDHQRRAAASTRSRLSRCTAAENHRSHHRRRSSP